MKRGRRNLDKIDGWIRDLHADYTGRTITRGEQLPLSTAQRCLRPRASSCWRTTLQCGGRRGDTVRDHAERLVQAARERLLRWDLSGADIRA